MVLAVVVVLAVVLVIVLAGGWHHGETCTERRQTEGDKRGEQRAP